jgi:hypothetical protein
MIWAGGMPKQAWMLVLLAVGPLVIAAEESTIPSLPAGYEIRFDRELGLRRALRLRYTKDSRLVDFRCEAGSQPVSGSALHLFLEHSPQLNPDRSFLSVSLNYGVLRSIRLDEANQRPTEIIIPLPPNLLHRANRLMFSVEQHYPAGTASAAIWTSILGRSYITIHAHPAPASNDLRELPLPLIDPNSYRPKAVDVLLPQWIAPPTLEATALLVANLVNHVATEPVMVNVVRSIAEATHPLLIVGTSDEQPGLRLVEAAARLSGDEGLAGISRGLHGKLSPVVFVTGKSPEGVLRAARRVALSAVSGNPVQVVDDTRYRPADFRAWKGFIPPNGHFTVRDLGIEDLTLGPGNDYTLVLPLRAPPDFRFFSRGAQMTLQFRLAPGFTSVPRHLIIQLNGVRLQDFDVSAVVKDSILSVPTNIPGGLLRSQNFLTISMPARKPSEESPPSAVLLANSQFTFPCDYAAELPDLSLLRFHFYPFSRSPDLSDLVIEVPHVVDLGMFEAVVELANSLGRLAPADRVDFRVRQMGTFSESERSDSQIIYLGDASYRGQPASAALHEAPSEWDRRKFVLTISAASTAALKQAIEQFFEEPKLNRLSGDTALVTTRGLICLATRRKSSVGERLLLLRLEVWLKTEWLALPGILAAVSAVLFAVWRLVLERLNRRQSAGWQEAD